MNHGGLFALVILAWLAILIGVPVVLGSRGGKWSVIALSTFVSPFLMVGVLRPVAGFYWAFLDNSAAAGCPGGECGANYAGAYWPLLIPVFMVPSFVISAVVVLLMRSARR